ncbi:MAG TPA: hypothetical protein VGM17_12830 [Rhizomicrobium sp.]|jgi:hypothetical protein
MTKPDRRVVIGGVAALGAVVVAGIGYEASHLIGKHYPPTPYDDLLALLPDREAAKAVGTAFLKDHPDFTAKAAAAVLRKHIGKQKLDAVLQREIASGALTEAGHWVVPQTLAGLCALAAKT